MYVIGLDISYVFRTRLFQAPASLTHIIKMASSTGKAIYSTTVIYIHVFWDIYFKKGGNMQINLNPCKIL